jgi:hypothetical protein
MNKYLRESLKWGAIVFVPLTLLALYLWNPNGEVSIVFLKIAGLLLAYPFLYAALEVQKYVPGPWLSLPVAIVVQLVWCVVLSLPVTIAVSWAIKRSPSNVTLHSDARNAPEPDRDFGARARGRGR